MLISNSSLGCLIISLFVHEFNVFGRWEWTIKHLCYHLCVVLGFVVLYIICLPFMMLLLELMNFTWLVWLSLRQLEKLAEHKHNLDNLILPFVTNHQTECNLSLLCCCIHKNNDLRDRINAYVIAES